MFGKMYPGITIYKKLALVVPHWVMDKKIVTAHSTHLPDNFNIIQLHTPNHLELHNVNKNGWWK